MRWFVPKLRRRRRPAFRICPVCDHRVQPGFQCSETVCPWEHAIRDDGKVILHDPLRLRIH